MTLDDIEKLLAQAQEACPLPWSQGYEDGEDENGAWENPTGAIKDASGDLICFDDDMLDLTDKIEAALNATTRLVVALANVAPELLAVAKAALNWRNGNAEEDNLALLGAARALEEKLAEV